ncbi:MAG TPA: AarF/ABC1/UbiB kinase family protein [Acidimicrobiia bacterium]|nr:AarF/ABC1/UbiB kinase family protein [Acidimicrobiia bacterium]
MVSRRRQRVLAVARVLGVRGLALARSWSRLLVAGRPDASARAAARRVAAVELRLTLEQLGVAATKVGQILSTRPDVLAPDFVEELGRLQDAAAPEPADVVEGVIESELGRPSTELFAAFDPVPLAAASIGQAHAATLPDGREVVVKVRRPGALEQVADDLGILERSVAVLTRWSRRARRIHLEDLVADFAETLRAELDYELEAANAERFATEFAGRPEVHIPAVHRAETTTRVITIERIRGIKLDDVEALDAAGIDRGALAATAADVVLTMVFEHNFFHADPHPGNFFVEADGRLGIIDFGMVGTVDASTSAGLLALLAALLGRDPDALGEAVSALGIGGPGIDRDGLLRDLGALLATHLDRPIGELAVGPLLNDVFGVFRRHRLRFPHRLALLAKTMAMCEGVAVQLDPTFRMMAVLVPYVERVAAGGSA